jgi:heat-inducible transcriptional repressor
MVENRYLDLTRTIDDSELERVHNLLESLVAGHSLRALRGLLAEGVELARGRVDELTRRAYDLGRRAIGEPAAAPREIVIEGGNRLMELPEYRDVARLRALLHALEDREQLVALIDKTIEAGNVSVYLGSDADDLADAQISLVVAPFHAEEDTVGTVGIIGPTRMDYARLMPLVGATADALTDAIKRSS